MKNGGKGDWTVDGVVILLMISPPGFFVSRRYLSPYFPRLLVSFTAHSVYFPFFLIGSAFLFSRFLRCVFHDSLFLFRLSLRKIWGALGREYTHMGRHRNRNTKMLARNMEDRLYPKGI